MEDVNEDDIWIKQDADYDSVDIAMDNPFCDLPYWFLFDLEMFNKGYKNTFYSLVPDLKNIDEGYFT